jgi:superoxide dismutase, Fe-Mn family
MTQVTRRNLLQAAAAVPILAATAAQSADAPNKGAPMNADAFGFQHTPVPLPFDAKSLHGISEKLIRSHWENNYVGASKALNTVRTRLTQALADSNTPPYVYTGLKREQSIRTGSVVLHELYFANLGGDGKAPADVRWFGLGCARVQ